MTTRQVNPDSRYLSVAIYQKLATEKQYEELTNLMRDAWMREATEANYLRLGSTSYYALAGQRIRALYTLQQAAEKGFAVPGSLKTPFFNSLQDNPDFQAILQQVRDNQAAMRKKVLALDNLLPGWQP
ncbi:MAG: hypothetical protein IIB77_10270 [Proteobacteria bacterium]|nr:hypothetical protein [Pseudomonadota bacterium]